VRRRWPVISGATSPTPLLPPQTPPPNLRVGLTLHGPRRMHAYSLVNATYSWGGKHQIVSPIIIHILRFGTPGSRIIFPPTKHPTMSANIESEEKASMPAYAEQEGGVKGVSAQYQWHKSQTAYTERKTSSLSSREPTGNPAEVKALRWKQDLRIVPLCAGIYLLCYLDRSNIGNAKTLNSNKHHDLLPETHMTSYQYTYARVSLMCDRNFELMMTGLHSWSS
jgi:hypothetical protein